MSDADTRPLDILKRGALRGIPVEEFGPVWASARLRLARASWQSADLSPFLQKDVPYTGTSSGRLSENAVDVVLAAHPGASGLRLLEIGAGSGVFARLFLGALKRRAPTIYAQSRYVVSDGSASILEAQRARGVLAQHEAIVEYKCLDVEGDLTALGSFDAILGTYILDSLPFDLLAIKDDKVWRREMRSVLDDATDAEALRGALASDDPAEMRALAHLAARLGIQTRYVAIDRGRLPLHNALPVDTGGETLPFVHCHGALDCVEKCLAQLKPGGVAIFSDYGHLTPSEPHDMVTFQAFGGSVAIGLNFPQITAAFSGREDARIVLPHEDEGQLHTRVFQRAPFAEIDEVVEANYGAIRVRALNAPCEAAREFLRGRMFDAARDLYAKSLVQEPHNWALIQEIALMLLASGRNQDARDMADAGLALNPLAAELLRIKGDALLALNEVDAAREVLKRGVELAPGNSAVHSTMAQAELKAGRHTEALIAIAHALALDREGDAKAELMALQEQVLNAIAREQLALLLASANLFRDLDAPPE